MKYFVNCNSVEEIKKTYRMLAMENHPDHGGDVETMKAINAEMEIMVARIITSGVDDFESEKGWRPDVDSEWFAEIIRKIINFNITIEIIGYWIYAFESFGHKDELRTLGFWFSKKHKAWVYSGNKKRTVRTPYTLQDVRDMHGSEVLKEREEQEAIA